MTLADIDLYRYELPLTPPLHLEGTTVRHRRGLLVRVSSEDGAVGWGDVAPLPGFSDESLDEVLEHARTTLPDWNECTIPDSVRSVDRLLNALPLSERPPPSLRFGLESAVLSLSAAHNGAALPAFLGASRSTVAINGLIADAIEDGQTRAVKCREAGYRAVKVKVGRAATDADAVRTIGQALGDQVALRLDANRAWSVEAAMAFAEAIEDVEIAYLEEPLADPSQLSSFVRRTGLPIALDETTRERGPRVLDELDRVSAVVLKPTLLGGMQRTRQWIQAAEEHDVAPIVSASYESGIGLQMLAVLAATGPDVPAGLSTYDRLGADVIAPRLNLDGPLIELDSMASSESQMDWNRLDPVLSST